MSLSANAKEAAINARVALVIGNADYKDVPLKNSGNDADAMAEKLRALGFKVILRQNIKQRQIGAAIAEFRSAVQPGGVSLFYYAGHGLQVRGENFLPAVDADIQVQDDVPNQSINLNQVLSAMDEGKSRINLVFLDACRNNPYTRGFRSAATGLAKVEAPSGTLIHFATRPGGVASDGLADGKNGLYTTQLLQAIDVPGLPVEQVLKRVTMNVKTSSGGKQEPWMEGSIDGDFFFIDKHDTQTHIQALLKKSTEAFSARRAQEVIELSREVLTLNRRETTAMANMSAAHMLLGQLAEAGEMADQAIAINPGHGPSYNNRGVVRERQGKTPEALQDYQRGCALNSAQSCRNAERIAAKS